MRAELTSRLLTKEQVPEVFRALTQSQYFGKFLVRNYTIGFGFSPEFSCSMPEDPISLSKLVGSLAPLFNYIGQGSLKLNILQLNLVPTDDSLREKVLDSDRSGLKVTLLGYPYYALLAYLENSTGRFVDDLNLGEQHQHWIKFIGSQLEELAATHE